MKLTQTFTSSWLSAAPALRVGCAVIASSLLVAGLAGCGSSKPKPAPLESFKPSASLKSVWTARVGESEGLQSISLNGGKVTVAGQGGELTQVDATTGQVIWRADLKEKLSASVGSDGRYAAVVTDQNDLVILDRGAFVWRERQPGRVLTTPFVAGERVFVQGVDRSVRAYDVKDGRWLWQYQRPGGEPLALSSQGVVSAYQNNLIVGQGSRLVGLDPLRGTVTFEVNMGSPRGTNEVERLADLVGPVVQTASGDICARVFQLSVACADPVKGSVRWSRNQSGYRAVAATTTALVAADGADRLTAWKLDAGDLMWRIDRFANRGLSAPVVWGDRLAVVDNEGYLNVLAQDDGRTLARFEVGAAAAATPTVAGDLLLVLTKKGTLYAMRAN